MNRVEIIKASGEKDTFKIEKLTASLRKAGASSSLAGEIAQSINKTIYDGLSTKEIYKQAFALLRKQSRPTAARYKLKKAIMELGDTGYPFEKFVGALLNAEDFDTQVGVIVQGQCVTHEVDVIALKDKLHYMCECKFHNRQGRQCNVKIPLYINSRFKDVEAQWQKLSEHGTKFHQGWIFTNTRFTSDAEQYAECIGLQLISWNYPEGNSLKDRIDKTGVHPITCLTSLTKNEKRKLIDVDIITCKAHCNNENVLDKLSLTKTKRNRVMNEARAICKK